LERERESGEAVDRSEGFPLSSSRVDLESKRESKAELRGDEVVYEMVSMATPTMDGENWLKKPHEK
jgi:hypothetical protein